MKKLLVAALCANAILLIFCAWHELPIAQSGGEGGGPLMDERFCTDANGDGSLDIADAITILQHLFQPDGEPPYCVTQGINLEDEFAALQARVDTALTALSVAQARISVLEVPGCTDANAGNFEVRANVDDGSCEYLGCTEPLALNYDAMANVDNGSCRYEGDAPGRLKFYTITLLPPLTIHVPESQSDPQVQGGRRHP